MTLLQVQVRVRVLDDSWVLCFRFVLAAPEPHKNNTQQPIKLKDIKHTMNSAPDNNNACACSFNRMMLQMSLSCPNEVSELMRLLPEQSTLSRDYLTWISFFTAFALVEQHRDIESKRERESKDNIRLGDSDDDELTPFTPICPSSLYTTSARSQSSSSSSNLSSSSFCCRDENIPEHSEESISKERKVFKNSLTDTTKARATSKIQELETRNHDLEDQLLKCKQTLVGLKADNDDKIFELEESNRSFTAMIVSLKEELADLREFKDNFLDEQYVCQYSLSPWKGKLRRDSYKNLSRQLLEDDFSFNPIEVSLWK